MTRRQYLRRRCAWIKEFYSAMFEGRITYTGDTLTGISLIANTTPRQLHLDF